METHESSSHKRKKTWAKRHWKEGFLTMLAKEKWKKYGSATVLSGRGVRLPPLDQERLMAPLRHLGWQKIVELPREYYEEAVRYFYCNLEYHTTGDPAEDELQSLVGGQIIGLNLDDIARIFEISNEGVHWYVNDVNELEKLVGDVKTFYSLLTGTPVGLKSIKKHQFEVQGNYMLYYRFLVNTLAPKKGHQDEIHPMHALMMYCMGAGFKLNLPYILLRQMAGTIGKGDPPSLPYGALLTKVFQAYKANLSTMIASEVKGPIDATNLKLSQPKAKGKKKVGESSGAAQEQGQAREADPETQAWMAKFWRRQDQHEQQIAELGKKVEDTRTYLDGRLSALQVSQSQQIERMEARLMMRFDALSVGDGGLPNPPDDAHFSHPSTQASLDDLFSDFDPASFQ